MPKSECNCECGCRKKKKRRGLKCETCRRVSGKVAPIKDVRCFTRDIKAEKQTPMVIEPLSNTVVRFTVPVQLVHGAIGDVSEEHGDDLVGGREANGTEGTDEIGNGDMNAVGGFNVDTSGRDNEFGSGFDFDNCRDFQIFGSGDEFIDVGFGSEKARKIFGEDTSVLERMEVVEESGMELREREEREEREVEDVESTLDCFDKCTFVEEGDAHIKFDLDGVAIVVRKAMSLEDVVGKVTREDTFMNPAVSRGNNVVMNPHSFMSGVSDLLSSVFIPNEEEEHAKLFYISLFKVNVEGHKVALWIVLRRKEKETFAEVKDSLFRKIQESYNGNETSLSHPTMPDKSAKLTELDGKALLKAIDNVLLGKNYAIVVQVQNLKLMRGSRLCRRFIDNVVHSVCIDKRNGEGIVADVGFFVESKRENKLPLYDIFCVPIAPKQTISGNVGNDESKLIEYNNPSVISFNLKVDNDNNLLRIKIYDQNYYLIKPWRGKESLEIEEIVDALHKNVSKKAISSIPRIEMTVLLNVEAGRVTLTDCYKHMSRLKMFLFSQRDDAALKPFQFEQIRKYVKDKSLLKERVCVKTDAAFAFVKVAKEYKGKRLVSPYVDYVVRMSEFHRNFIFRGLSVKDSKMMKDCLTRTMYSVSFAVFSPKFAAMAKQLKKVMKNLSPVQGSYSLHGIETVELSTLWLSIMSEVDEEDLKKSSFPCTSSVHYWGALNLKLNVKTMVTLFSDAVGKYCKEFCKEVISMRSPVAYTSKVLKLFETRGKHSESTCGVKKESILYKYVTLRVRSD